MFLLSCASFIDNFDNVVLFFYLPERRDSMNSDSTNQDASKEMKMEPKDEAGEEAMSSSDQQQSQHHNCPFCDYISDSEMRLQAHVLAQHGTNSSSDPVFQCPLCQDSFKERPSLERHVMQIHSVNSEGLQRLLMLVDQSHWLNQASRTPTPSTTTNNHLASPNSASSKDSSNVKLEKSDNAITENESGIMSPRSDESGELEYERCNTCMKNFKNIDELCFHQNETGHLEIKQTPTGPGYMCWKKGCNQFFPTAQQLQMHFKDVHAKNSISQMSVSEKHVYKYRCNQCSLAFKTMEKLQLHAQYHMIRDATKCVLCGRSFRSLVALHKHVESQHSELTDEELNTYKQSLLSNPLLLAGLQGQVLDSSTNDILKKENDSGEMDCDDSNKDQSHDDSNNQLNDGENSDDSIAYKDSQYLEDYLNSQAMAEDSYNDPNRKYKCHRCKVAFTRQSYLTAHNKTLLHRKGEKLSYPMEKYLDPNRPYKCDVCKESFTQKNILLVHYNSVSHLHKLKRAMQEQQNNNNNPPVSPVLSTATSGKNMEVDSDNDKKRYRCNICKVAYTQGSTLDIHMRSVLHQTRASKLQDLALAGQIDLSKPLIEQPEAREASPKIMGSPVASSGDKNSPTPPSPSSVSAGSQGMHPCSKCGASFNSSDQLAAHQQLYCMFTTPMAIFSQNNETTSQAKSPSPLADDPSRVTVPKNKSNANSQMYKHLLESFGFDLVMQYNESHQRRQRQKELEEKVNEEAGGQEPQQQPPPMATDATTPTKSEEDLCDLPEVSKSTCQHCNREFSSVWVLKSHCEEVHKDLVPLEFLEKYAQQFKNEYEKKVIPRDSSTPTPPAEPEKDAPVEERKDTKTPVEASSSGVPAPGAGDIPANIQAMIAQSMAQNPMALAQQVSEMQAALNAFQMQQQLNFNPMMQMIGMGLPLGLNAIAAMNLQPPLVPLMMPPPPYDPMGQFAQQDQQAILAKQQAIMQQQAVSWYLFT